MSKRYRKGVLGLDPALEKERSKSIRENTTSNRKKG